MEVMPPCAFGTMEYPSEGGAAPADGAVPAEVSCLEAATAEALKAGYRHLDVAEGYTTGTFVKNAVASSGVAREELWVTGKLTGLPCESSFEDTKQRAAALLGRLGLEYFDLLLMHFPGPSHMDVGAPPSDQKSVATAAFCRENMAVAWANMLRLLDAGMCRRIGVSNFYPFHIDLLLKVAKDTAVPVPFANQIFIDACHPEVDFVAKQQKLGIRVMAYRPVAFLPVVQMVSQMGDGLWSGIEALVAKHNSSSSKPEAAATSTDGDGGGSGSGSGGDDGGASSASGSRRVVVASPQAAVLAWLSRRGICPVSKSRSPAHIQANLLAATSCLKVNAGGGGGGDGGDDDDDDVYAWVDGIGEMGAASAEMVAMCGGEDEMAKVFREVSDEQEEAQARAEAAANTESGEAAAAADDSGSGGGGGANAAGSDGTTTDAAQ